MDKSKNSLQVSYHWLAFYAFIIALVISHILVLKQSSKCVDNTSIVIERLMEWERYEEN